LRDAILHFKYQRRDFLGDDLAAHWLNRTPYGADDYDVVVPVPQAPFKSWVRGYNPAEHVAAIIARRHGKLLADDALRRSLFSTSQTNKNKTQRLRNAQKGFRRGAGIRDLKGKRVLLVDDVCTTGATLGVCARLLKQSGVRRVLGAAVARDMLA
jgi:ComF family protein